MKINVYTTPTCPWCVKVKDYLAHKGVSYNEFNVAANRDAAMEMIRKSGQRGVPVLDINGEIIIGFDQSRIDSLIGHS